MPTFNALAVGCSEDYPLSRLLSVRKQASNWNAMNAAATGQRLSCKTDHTSGVVRVTKEELLYHVQETLGGWKQEAVFSGSLSDCQDYYEKNHLDMQSGWAIVADTMYEVDCLDEAR